LVFSLLLPGRPSGKFLKMLKISACRHRSSKDSLRLSRGTYARNDFNPASADVGDAHILEFH
jgi:hypothetical protein